MATATLKLRVRLTGMAVGERTLEQDIVLGSAPGSFLRRQVSGGGVFGVPAGSTYAWLRGPVPAVSSTVRLMGTASGDTGVTLRSSGLSLVGLDTGATTVRVTGGATSEIWTGVFV